MPIRIGAFEVTKTGVSRFDLRDPYHLAVTLRWPEFFVTLLLVYLVINLVFAVLYWAEPGSISNAGPSFSEAFFFSIETLATVGYGVMAPATLYGHIVSSVENRRGNKQTVEVRHVHIHSGAQGVVGIINPPDDREGGGRDDP